MIEPKAGKVPGIKEPAKLATPSATSSRLGLIEYRYRAALYLAATMLSKKPTTDIKLFNVDKYGRHQKQKGNQTDIAVDVVRRRYLRLELLRGNSRRDSPVFILTEPRISMPSFSHLSWAERTEKNCQTLICQCVKKKRTDRSIQQQQGTLPAYYISTKYFYTCP